MSINKIILVAISILIFPDVLAAVYHTDASLCDGFPRVKVETMPGTCVGLVLQDNKKQLFKKPRKIVAVRNTDAFLITDMGGWSDNRGSLFLLKKVAGQYQILRLLNKLNLPHGLSHGPNNSYLLGEKDKIIEFKLVKDKLVDMRTVVSDLPAWKEHLHPLTHFILDNENNLIVNTGASSDQCLNEKPKDCAFAAQAGLRKYLYIKQDREWSKDYSMLATGLRNSMALAIHSSGTILQAENSMDFKDAAEPYEEINIIKAGQFYGWPYCYNHQAVNSAWTNKKAICFDNENYTQPFTLMPPHVAPLDMLYYQGNLIPSLKDKLIISWHGYRIVGNRLVAYHVDDQGQPVLNQQAHFFKDPYQSKAFTKHEFTAKGGFIKVAQHVEVISRWNSLEGIRPEGAPVGLTVADDGSIWIVDDKNQAVLRLSNGEPYKDKTIVAHQATVKFPDNIHQIINKHCTACHNTIDHGLWFSKVDGRYLVEQRVFFDSERPMPINSVLSELEKAQLLQFFKALKSQ